MAALSRRANGTPLSSRSWVYRAAPVLLAAYAIFAPRPAGAQVLIEYDSAAHRSGQRAKLSYTSSRNRIVKGPAGVSIMRPPNEVDLSGDGLDIEVRNLLVVLRNARGNSRIAIGVPKAVSFTFPRAPIAASATRADSVVLQAEGLRLRIARPVLLRQDGDTLRLSVLHPE